ncbi:MAG: hypothetical protein JWL95_2971 [Gemmatimonadetes bacterium]|nr:hypothetical protein [Gemmatimonadota bacterium]
MPSSYFAAWRGAHVVRALAAAALVVGYLDLVRGGITLAPALLVAGYVVLVPLALLAE